MAVGPSTGEYRSLDAAKDGSDNRASNELSMRNDVSLETADDTDDDTDDDEPVEQPNIHATAEAWIQAFDKLNPVSDTDADLQRFEDLTRTLITRLCQEARSGRFADWLKIAPDKREMSFEMKSALINANADKLADHILRHIPRKTKQLLGKRDLQPFDLLSLPEFPPGCPYSIVYFDIAVQVGIANIESRYSRLSLGRTMKPIKSCSRYNHLMKTKVYLGSSSDKEGGWNRLRVHEKEANRESGRSNMHYDFTRQADVVTNFCIGALFPPSSALSEGIALLLPELLEGILMVYLGTYHVSYLTPLSDGNMFHTASSYELVGRMRLNLSVPDLHRNTLNIAWPILQAGGYREFKVDRWQIARMADALGLLKAEVHLDEHDDQQFIAALEAIRSKTRVSSAELEILLAKGGASNPNYEPPSPNNEVHERAERVERKHAELVEREYQRIMHERGHHEELSRNGQGVFNNKRKLAPESVDYNERHKRQR
ncbi:hypothetical protein SNK03_001730 [Fusarium graminearum]